MTTNKTSSTPLLNREDTLKFRKQVDLACRLLDTSFLEETIYKFGLENSEDSRDFLDASSEQLEFWKNSKKIVKIMDVKEFRSRCIACAFGKTVQAYEVSYAEEGPADGVQIVYSRNFAIYIELVDEKLTGFSWCNAFLNKKETETFET
ncbi:MAG: hypothetical protein WCD31_09435 [Gillisia sp.]